MPARPSPGPAGRLLCPSRRCTQTARPGPAQTVGRLLSHAPQAIGCLHEQAGQAHFNGSCQGLTTNLHALTTQALQSHVFKTPLNLQIQPGAVAWSTTLGPAAGDGLNGAQVRIALTGGEDQTATACTLTNHQLNLVSTVAITAMGCKTQP